MSEPPSEHLKTLSAQFSWRARELPWPVTSEVGAGLAGVVASTTRVSWLDPASGALAYRGIPVEQVAAELDFEQTAYLLATGDRPEEGGLRWAEFREEMRGACRIPDGVRELLREMDPMTHPVRLLRAGVSALGCHELEADEEISGTRHWHRPRIIGQVAALVAEIARLRRGSAGGRGSGSCPLADEVLAALRGRDPEPEELRLLNLLWVLYADHGLDAPTFTSMIVASCLADPYYNVVAGLSALHSGRLGGAGQRVLEQLLPLSGPERAREWAREMLDRGRRIAGFGHRIYRMEDPRAVLLRRELAAEARRAGREELFAVARAVEQEAAGRLAAKGVYVNINFYAAPLFHLLGAEPEQLPVLYMVGRMAGLVARVQEALEEGRLYRPLTRYEGPGERGLPPGLCGEEER